MNIVLDTNIWVSYFMAGEHVELVNFIYKNDLNIFTNKTFIAELEDVLNRPKIKKFIRIPVVELIDFHCDICILHKTLPIYQGSPDPKDNFLFDLAIQTNSIYVVTGDKIILAQKSSAFKFITKSEFEKLVK